MVITLSVVVNGWVAILQPIVLSLGAVFTVLNLDVDLITDIQPWLSSKKVKEVKKEKKREGKNLGVMIDEMLKIKNKGILEEKPEHDQLQDDKLAQMKHLKEEILEEIEDFYA